MNQAHHYRPEPSIFKACSRCHNRKVKCDLRVPKCSACKRQNEKCNITECISYSYASVDKLQEIIADLQSQLAAATASSQPVQTFQSHAAGNVNASSTQPAPSLEPRLEPSSNHAQATDLRNEAEEIGILAIGGSSGHSANRYVGSAAGSTFARIFFKQSQLVLPTFSSHHSGAPDLEPPDEFAALPPRPIAKFLLHTYIARVHVWWPFVKLSWLRKAFQHAYEDSRNTINYTRFLVFVVMALASAECAEDQAYRDMLDLNKPQAYFKSSLRFLTGMGEGTRDLRWLQAVLFVTIWSLTSTEFASGSDLWQLSRYAMSLAIELGLHRHNPGWGFSPEEVELRNRTWWCVYSMERHVSIITGRVLSIRDHAVHALEPANMGFDALVEGEPRAAPVFYQKGVELFKQMLQLRRLSGRVLESVYIARGAQGQAHFTSFQELCSESDALQKDLERWRRNLDQELKGTREYAELKIEYCLLLLLMSRPSPTFMIPSGEMVATCSRAASSAVHQWHKIESQFGISAICRCMRQFHNILMVALTALYCDWRKSKQDFIASSVPRGPVNHEDEVTTCIRLLGSGVAYMKMDHLVKYQQLLRSIQGTIYHGLSHVGPMADSSMTIGTEPSQFQDAVDAAGYVNPVFPDSSGLEAYLNQVSSFFDDNTIGMDDALTGWYGNVMNEMQM